MASLRPPISMSDVSPSVGEIAALADSTQVREAIAWLQSEEAKFQQWQMDLAGIPAPPFGEEARGRWLAERFRELQLEDVHTDEVGNVIGVRSGTRGDRESKNAVALSAHLDTVFAAAVSHTISRHGSRLQGPSVSDNAAGVVALLAIAAALQHTKIDHAAPVIFIGNVGEEGEGDLRGMRHIFFHSPFKETIRFSLVLDGAGSDTIVAEALGSRRFEVTVRGPGGHSWSDFGTPNPIFALARVISIFAQTPISASPKTTFNIGVIQGGTSVNSIPESASMRVDIRSTAMYEMQRLESALRHAVRDSLDDQSQLVAGKALASTGRKQARLTAEIAIIGDRPAGELPSGARMLPVLRAVDSYIGNSAQVQRASTDANIPLSIGREALAIGAGGTGGGAHTLQEWFDCQGREVGLKRILLTALTLASIGETSV